MKSPKSIDEDKIKVIVNKDQKSSEHKETQKCGLYAFLCARPDMHEESYWRYLVCMNVKLTETCRQAANGQRQKDEK